MRTSKDTPLLFLNITKQRVEFNYNCDGYSFQEQMSQCSACEAILFAICLKSIF